MPVRLFTRQSRKGHEQLQPRLSQARRRPAPPGLARKWLTAEVYRIFARNPPGLRASVPPKFGIPCQPNLPPRSTRAKWQWVVYG